MPRAFQPEGEPQILPFLAAKTGTTVELTFCDFIGSELEGISSQQVDRALRDAGNVSEIHVKINSYGGFAHEGVGIYNILKNHPAKVTTDVVGVAYSAASIIAMAGDVRTMRTGTNQMIHNAVGLALGHAKDMRSVADSLDLVSNGVAEIYAATTGLSMAKIRQMMDETTYMNAAECLEFGFTTTVPLPKASPASNSGPSKALAEQYVSLTPVTRARMAVDAPRDFKMLRDAASHWGLLN